MQDWDRLATILIGGGVALHTLYQAWKEWRAQRPLPAAGAVLLALATVILPIILAAFGG